MAEETAEQKVARLEAENRALKEQVEQRRTKSQTIGTSAGDR